MSRLLLTATLLAAAGGAAAEDCASLGIADPVVAGSLCAELKALGAGARRSRGLTGDTPAGRDRPALEDWAQIGLIQDAYRNDPRKTLELIRRIKDAGGLAPE